MTETNCPKGTHSHVHKYNTTKDGSFLGNKCAEGYTALDVYKDGTAGVEYRFCTSDTNVCIVGEAADASTDA